MNRKEELETRVAQAVVDHINAVDEYNRLQDEIKDMRSELSAKEDRRSTLKSVWGGHGVIAGCYTELQDAKRALEDEDHRVVVWTVDDRCHHDVIIVSKVTAKRIYTRAKGHAMTTYYDKVTGEGSSNLSPTIDIAATFPEGVDNFKN